MFVRHKEAASDCQNSEFIRFHFYKEILFKVFQFGKYKLRIENKVSFFSLFLALYNYLTRVSLEKLVVAYLINNISTFYENRSFIPVSTRAKFWTL